MSVVGTRVPAALLFTVCLIVRPGLVAAQQQDGSNTRITKHAQAVRIPNGKISVDGRMSEPEWQTADPATDFVQQQPDEGRPATHNTEMRFLYDDEYLYLGGMLHEDEPGKLVTNELKRDFNARDGDLLVVVLDTFYDKLNSYDLQTNPGCALRDSQSYDDGRTINANWDAVWFCRSTVEGATWYVEEAIPFKQLRFPSRDEQTWGLQILRLIRHRNEFTIWNPVPRQFNQFKTSYEGVLDGIRDVRPGRNVRFKPFATGQVRRANGVNHTDGDGGFDTKIGLGTNLVLDGTYRTDFSQVEADAQQVNLTRFNLFFPEKREFFLENQGAFQIGPPAASNSNLVPFFSRTIGLSDTGNPIPIVGGLRVTGKIGRNQIGALNMQTEREERVGLASLPAANASVLRYGREFLSNSMAGVFYMDKERGGVSNRVVGSDMRFYPTRAWNLDALVMRSDRTGVGSGMAWRGGAAYTSGLDVASVSYTSLGHTFQDDLGFIPRQGVNILASDYFRRWRPKATLQWIREYRPELSYSRYTADSVVQTATLTPSVTAEFVDASTVSVSMTRDEEALTRAFRPQGIPAGFSIPADRYTFNTGEVQYNPSNSHVLAPSADVRFGEFYNGNRTGFTIGARARLSEKLATTFGFSRDQIDLPDTSFHTDLASLRIDASFSTGMFLNAFVQYNNVTHQLLSNIRYDFIHHPLSDIFIVYNETRDTDGAVAPSRAIIVKVTHLLSF